MTRNSINQTIDLALHSSMVSQTNCAGKYQRFSTSGWRGSIISMWNLHCNIWNHRKLTGLQAYQEVPYPAEQPQIQTGINFFGSWSTLSQNSTMCMSLSSCFPLFILLVILYLDSLAVQDWNCDLVYVCVVLSTMGPGYLSEASGW